MSVQNVLISVLDPAIKTEIAAVGQQLGIQVLSAEPDPFSLLALMLPLPPDVLFVDVFAAGGPGLPLCQIIASDPRFSGMRTVVVLPSQCDEDVDRQCFTLGVYTLEASSTFHQELFALLRESPTAEFVTRRKAKPGESGADDAWGDLPRPRVLIIDDDGDYIKALKIRLTARGVHVSCAFNGTQGFWTAVRDRPDAIISDLSMPEGCGDYVINRIQRHPVTKGIPIVIVTGRKSSDNSLERNLIASGATAVFEKPPDFDALLDELSRHFESEVDSGALTVA